MARPVILPAVVSMLALFACDKPPANTPTAPAKGAAASDVVSPPPQTSQPTTNEHVEGASDSKGHHHPPPHGGKLVELDEDHVFIEICLNANLGEIAIYITDGDAPIRIPQPTIELHAAVPGFDVAKHVIDLSIPARDNPLTGDKAGDAAEFRARHDNLYNLSSLEGVIAEIFVRGKKYENVKFSTNILADNK